MDVVMLLLGLVGAAILAWLYFGRDDEEGHGDDR